MTNTEIFDFALANQDEGVGGYLERTKDEWMHTVNGYDESLQHSSGAAIVKVAGHWAIRFPDQSLLTGGTKVSYFKKPSSALKRFSALGYLG